MGGIVAGIGGGCENDCGLRVAGKRLRLIAISNPQSATGSPGRRSNAKKKRRGWNPRRLPHSIGEGYASRAVIGTLRPTERRRATHRKWVDRISSLELYVLPKETGNRVESAQPVIQVACQKWS